MIEQKYIDMILDRIDIEDVVSEYVGSEGLKKKGTRLWACCPFHSEKTPSFCVEPAKGTWHCYGSCQEGGNVIGFVMKAESLPFPLAVKKLLKDQLHIDLKEQDMQSTPEEEEKEKKRQSMFIYNDYLQKFFHEQLHAETPEAKAAVSYMKHRWKEDYCREMGIGYAPSSWDALIEWAKKTGLDLDILQEMKVINKSEKGKLYSFYRNRLMIPIRDRYSRITGWTARTLDDKEDRKYLNSAESEIYSKDHSVFGIDTAARKARQEEKIYLVEGGPDVMKLQSLGILNTVASLGGAWTKNQFDLLRKFNATLCFIPDSDNDKPEGKRPGELNVIKNGTLAMQEGFTVSVREIPNETSKKMDPDSFVTNKTIFDTMQEEEFLTWFARKKWNDDFTTEERLAFMNKVCDLIACIQDENTQTAYIAQMGGAYGHKHEWLGAYKSARRRKLEAISKNNRVNGDIDMLRQFGFIEKHKCYFGINKDGNDVQWSNFRLKPLFHIKDDIRPVRLFEIDNDDPDQKKEIIELDMEVFTSAKNLRKKLLGIGNYTWLAGENELIQLQRYLAKVTETAVELKQLGWNKKGFYCFCNGAQEDGVWHPVDDMGIIRLKAGKFYLPAMSQIYRESQELYVNERKFRHLTYSKIPLHDYFQKIVEVFGDNGKVGICFFLATLFRDIVKGKARFFPILNIFGPKGSGKTELANTLMSFFMVENDPPNLETGTMAALADLVGSVSNALVHVDEYKNGVVFQKIEWLKDLWGGVGRTKMNMDKDKKREQARVDSGVILTGQEMPTADIALFTRLIYLTVDKQHHSQEERDRYADLLHYRLMGATHITLEIEKHREKFEASFGGAWKKAEADVEYMVKGKEIMDRIERNWLVPLAAYLSLADVLQMPFTYENLLKICVDGIIKQNDMCASTDEVSSFWNIISSAQQKGILMYGQDYIIKTKDRLRTNQQKTPIDFETPKQILMFRKNIMLTTYRQLGRQMDERLLPSESILHYLQISPEFYGTATQPERFKKFNTNGMPMQEPIMDGERISGYKTVYNQDRPLCFDYKMVSEKYGIILDSYTGEIEQKEEEKTQPKQEELPFSNTEDNNGDAPF